MITSVRDDYTTEKKAIQVEEKDMLPEPYKGLYKKMKISLQKRLERIMDRIPLQ